MSWLCNINSTFKLFPKIGNWGCYDENGNFSFPISSNEIISNLIGFFILFILINIMIDIYYSAKKVDNKKFYKI